MKMNFKLTIVYQFCPLATTTFKVPKEAVPVGRVFRDSTTRNRDTHPPTRIRTATPYHVAFCQRTKVFFLKWLECLRDVGESLNVVLDIVVWQLLSHYDMRSFFQQ